MDGKKNRRGPQAGGHQGPAIIPPKALRILVRICSQVPAKVQSVLLVACVRSLGGRREGEIQKQTTHQKTKTKLSSATPNRDRTIHCQANAEKSIPPAMSQRNQHLTHAMLRKPAPTTHKQFQTKSAGFEHARTRATQMLDFD